MHVCDCCDDDVVAAGGVAGVVVFSLTENEYVSFVFIWMPSYFTPARIVSRKFPICFGVHVIENVLSTPETVPPLQLDAVVTSLPLTFKVYVNVGTVMSVVFAPE